MHIPSFIEHKREGAEHPPGDIAHFIAHYSTGEIPDYQAAAWAMAVFFRGMTPSETTALTLAMRDSGTRFQWPAGTPPKVDKHSTGGIGDKVSLILAPLLATEGVWVPMISGRGLGITGGTLDKLESIPGFRTQLSPAETLTQLDRIGVAMLGQTADLCPADKKLYALRDVTATVPSQPLIVASILSKKLAESLDRLVLDVKFGSGAFMKTRPDAEALAAALTATGNACGLTTTALLNPMEEPLGHTAGNALEVAEAVATLQGRGPRDLVELTLDLAQQLVPAPRENLAASLVNGAAWKKWVALVEAQGGNAADSESILEIHPAPLRQTLRAETSGTVTRVDAGSIGRACIALGAGRTVASDPIDYAVGCADIVKTGTRVVSGDPLLTLHARDSATLDLALDHLRQAIHIA